MNFTTSFFSPRAAVIAGLVLVLSFGGCKSAAPPPDDNSLNSALQSKLGNDAALSAEPIQTFVQGGTATLQGAVSSEAAKALAANDAAQVPGIKRVVNQLTVQTAHAIPQVPPAVVVAPPPPVRTSKPPATVKRPAERYAWPPVTAPAPIERHPLESAQPDQQAFQPLPPPAPCSPAATCLSQRHPSLRHHASGSHHADPRQRHHADGRFFLWSYRNRRSGRRPGGHPCRNGGQWSCR